MQELYPPVKGIVGIAHDIHATSEQALKDVLAHLSTEYDIKNCTDSRGWYASLKESVKQNAAKCDYCQGYSTNYGCKRHGYTCEKCGEIIYWEYLNGDILRFAFKKDDYFSYVNLKIHSFVDDKILCYPEYVVNHRAFSATEDRFKSLMEKFKDEYEVVGNLYAFYYSKDYEKAKINVSEVMRGELQHCHYQSVILYKGKEYDDEYSLPVRESYMIYDTYKDAPAEHDGLAQHIIGASRQVARCDYYYQDGREAFYGVIIEWMALYIEYFTDLDVKKFRKFLRYCRKDGPGFIVQFSHWVGEQTGVKQSVINEPNIGNLIIGMSKLGKESITDDELYAMMYAIQDKKSRHFYDMILRE